MKPDDVQYIPIVYIYTVQYSAVDFGNPTPLG